MKAGAGSFFYHFDYVFSGTSPDGPSAWVNAQFTDGSSGTVNLTLSTGGLTGTEFISELYLNLNNVLNPNSLIFTLTSSIGTFSNPSISTGVDQFKADGDGKYDVLLGFSTAGTGRFGVGDSITYQITGIAGLQASDFDFLSAPAGGSGPFLSAAHVQSIGNGNSGWIAPTILTPAPEPATAVLLGSAMIIWAGARRFRNRSQGI
ncbi:MAG: hypothetical protein JWR26_25 [Pedosphaera sp.]|nr:hypothetical protein [Pedosphaera sp.]